MMFGMGKKKSDEPLPVYMDEVEFSQLLAIVEAVGPSVLVEWGSGGSPPGLMRGC